MPDQSVGLKIGGRVYCAAPIVSSDASAKAAAPSPNGRALPRGSTGLPGFDFPQASPFFV